MKRLFALTLAAALGTTAMPALAQSAGDFTVGLGIGVVAPKDNTGLLAGAPSSIDNDLRPTLTFEYFIMDNVGIEVLAATPFEHTVTISGVGTVVTKHLPPTVSVNYHFANDSKFTPFVGAGVNFTTFWDETSALGNVNLDNSWGLALHAGLDVAISDKGALRADLRYVDIDTKATLGGAPIGTANIDPLVFGLSYVHNF